MNKPPPILLNALSALKADGEVSGFELGTYLHEILRKSPNMQAKYGRPHERDDLYRADYEHVGDSRDCDRCDKSNLVNRTHRKSTTEPEIHYGNIASGNSKIRSAAERQKLNKDLGGKILCCETEASGLMTNFSCLVMRGIYNYADSHNNGRWKRYAAITAAALTRKLLTIIPSSEVKETAPAQQIADPCGQYTPTSGLPFVPQPVPHTNKFLPESQYPSFRQEALSHNDFSTEFGQQPAYQRALPSDQSTSEPEQLFLQHRASPSNHSQPKTGSRSAYSSPDTAKQQPRADLRVT